MKFMTREDIEKRRKKEDRHFNDRDLSGVDMSRLSFRERKFHRSILRRANLSHTRFNSVTFKQASLTGANLRHAIFEYCDFRDCDLSDADLTHASFDCTDFHECHLDRALVKNAMFDTCDFKATTWNGAKVKRTNFEDCQRVQLPPHKVYKSLSDIDDENVSAAICRERFAPLASLLNGTYAQDDEFSFVWGFFRERKFRIDVAYHVGCPSAFLALDSPMGVFYLYRDVKKANRLATIGGTRIQLDDQWFHHLSEEVFLDGTPGELDRELQTFERLPGSLRDRIFAMMGKHKLEIISMTPDGLNAEYKKDILHLDLTTSIPDVLELFCLICDAFSGHPVTENPPISVPAAISAGPVVTSVPLAVPPTPIPKAPEPEFSFDLNRRCRRCNASIPWGQLECTACGHDPMKTG